MHASKDSMWREIWKILQIFLETKQGLSLIGCLPIPELMGLIEPMGLIGCLCNLGNKPAT